MNVRYHRSVRADLESAITYYEQQAPHLGVEFLKEFEAAVSRILETPTRFPLISKDKRRVRLKRFPYVAVFRHDGSQIRVLLVKHQKRHPDFGMGRR